MPLDANILLQGREFKFENPMELKQNAMTLKKLSMQNAEMEAEAAEKQNMKDILKRNTVTGGDGKTSLNRGAALGELAQANPEKAMAFKKQLEEMDLDELKRNTEGAYTLSWSATPENWGEIREKAISMGLKNADKLPPVYSPQFVKNWQMGTLSGKEQIAHREAQMKTDYDRNKDERAHNLRLREVSAAEKNAGIARNEKALEKAEKKKASVNEVEDRRLNINYNIDRLSKMIDEDGTYEMFGKHNQELDRLVDEIATDTAKLMDPSSVARPSEVESVKKNLIQSGMQNSNHTAKEILKSFKADIANRANSAYKVRGLSAPGSTGPDDLETMGDEELLAEHNRTVKGSKNANSR